MNFQCPNQIDIDYVGDGRYGVFPYHSNAESSDEALFVSNQGEILCDFVNRVFDMRIDKNELFRYCMTDIIEFLFSEQIEEVNQRSKPAFIETGVGLPHFNNDCNI